jgi:hypothetical protein
MPVVPPSDIADMKVRLDKVIMDVDHLMVDSASTAPSKRTSSGEPTGAYISVAEYGELIQQVDATAQSLKRVEDRMASYDEQLKTAVAESKAGLERVGAQMTRAITYVTMFGSAAPSDQQQPQKP